MGIKRITIFVSQTETKSINLKKKKIMNIIANNVKYPEFREMYNGRWITGHLVQVGDMYYNHSKRTVTEYSYAELPEQLLASVEAYLQAQIEKDARIEEMKQNLRAHNALVDWARANAHEVARSNQSESEYYFVHHTDGRTYEVRVSGHRYPTGSMTDLMLGKIDSTDTCCAKYCQMLGINY